MSLRISALLPSWEIALKAQRRSPETIRAYTGAVQHYARWCAAHGQPEELDRRRIQRWLADMLDAGAEGNTARTRLLGLKRFSAWCTTEGEVDADPTIGINPPRLDAKPVDGLTAAQVGALLATCSGRGFADRRDNAIFRIALETGARAGEVVNLAAADVDLRNGTVLIRKGKGGKGRVVPIGPTTCLAVDRYLRARRGHRLAASPALWLGDRGRTFSYSALRDAAAARGQQAGIPGMHFHRLRHTFASAWLAAGGSEGGLMTVAGWTSRSMIDRYAADTATARALEEAKRLGLGEHHQPPRC